MNTDKTTIIDRVRKILVKTEEAGCTPEESATAFQMASRLMAEHNLDMADMETSSGGEASWVTEEANAKDRFDLEDNLKYGICRSFFFVEGSLARRQEFYKGRNQNRIVLRFFGRPENAQAARYVFAALGDAFTRLFTEYRRNTGAPASDRRLFVTGVASGFSQKLRDERLATEMERDVVQGKTSGSTGLAIRDIAEQTRVAFKEHNPGLFRANGQSKGGGRSFAPVAGSSSALDAGVRAGKTLNLNRSVGGNSQKGIGN